MLRALMHTGAVRRRITRLFRPQVERAAWAGGAMTEADWATSRNIGFLAGAINRAASQDNLDEEGMFAVQLGVWDDLTGTSPDLFATRLYLLSSDGDSDVLAGYQAGASFADALLSKEDEIAYAAWDANVMRIAPSNDQGFGG